MGLCLHIYPLWHLSLRLDSSPSSRRRDRTPPEIPELVRAHRRCNSVTSNATSWDRDQTEWLLLRAQLGGCNVHLFSSLSIHAIACSQGHAKVNVFVLCVLLCSRRSSYNAKIYWSHLRHTKRTPLRIFICWLG